MVNPKSTLAHDVAILAFAQFCTLATLTSKSCCNRMARNILPRHMEDAEVESNVLMISSQDENLWLALCCGLFTCLFASYGRFVPLQI